MVSALSDMLRKRFPDYNQPCFSTFYFHFLWLNSYIIKDVAGSIPDYNTKVSNATKMSQMKIFWFPSA